MESNHYVGVDVSKSSLDFAVCKNGEIISCFHCENTKKGIGQVIKEMRKLDDFGMTKAVFCMEFTGIYNNILLDYLLSCDSSIWLEPGLRIKQSQGMTRGKTDAIDAVRIAEYAYTFRDKIRLWTPVREEIKKLRALISLRERIVNSIKELSVFVNENSKFVHKEISDLERKFTDKSISTMKNSLKQIEKEIQQLIKKDEPLKKMFDLMMSIPGVGPVVAANMIVVTEEFKKFKEPSQFSCYSGVAPFEHTSGSSIKKRSKVSHLANKKIKTLLHMAAIAAIKAKGDLRDYYQRKVAQGKHKMCVINAIRNKIIHRIFAVIKRGTEYQKNYLNPIA